jgi:hypothetical protein
MVHAFTSSSYLFFDSLSLFFIARIEVRPTFRKIMNAGKTPGAQVIKFRIAKPAVSVEKTAKQEARIITNNNYWSNCKQFLTME